MAAMASLAPLAGAEGGGGQRILKSPGAKLKTSCSARIRQS